MLTIKVVGSGCPTCQKLEAMCKKVVEENHLDAKIEKITDVNEFVELGIFMTPGLILNDTVVSSGKLPTEAELKNWLLKADQ